MQIFEKWPSAWRGVIETGARRFYLRNSCSQHITKLCLGRTLKLGKRRRKKSHRYPIIRTSSRRVHLLPLPVLSPPTVDVTRRLLLMDAEHLVTCGLIVLSTHCFDELAGCERFEFEHGRCLTFYITYILYCIISWNYNSLLLFW